MLFGVDIIGAKDDNFFRNAAITGGELTGGCVWHVIVQQWCLNVQRWAFFPFLFTLDYGPPRGCFSAPSSAVSDSEEGRWLFLLLCALWWRTKSRNSPKVLGFCADKIFGFKNDSLFDVQFHSFDQRACNALDNVWSICSSLSIVWCAFKCGTLSTIKAFVSIVLQECLEWLIFGAVHQSQVSLNNLRRFNYVTICCFLFCFPLQSHRSRFDTKNMDASDGKIKMGDWARASSNCLHKV